MAVDDLLKKLTKVRRSGQGWIACCPSHPDRTPSLFIREGMKAILVKCWAGCSLDDICQALGIHKKDLFYDTNCNPREIHRRQAERQYKKAKTEVEQMAEGFQVDVIREAERFLKATIGTDISTLDDTQLDTLMNSVCDALVVRLKEERGEYVNG